MSPKITEWAAYISSASITIPLIVYLIKVKIFPRENHVIGMLVAASATFELLRYFSFQEIHYSNLSGIYNFLWFVILSFYYWKVVFEFEDRSYFYLGLAGYIASLSYVIILEDGHIDQGGMCVITSGILFYFGIVYNNYQAKKPPLFDKNLYSRLIFNGAIMFYFGCNVILFFILSYLFAERDSEMKRLLEVFHNSNNIIKNIAFAFGFYYTGRRRINLTDDEIDRIQWRHLG